MTPAEVAGDVPCNNRLCEPFLGERRLARLPAHAYIHTCFHRQQQTTQKTTLFVLSFFAPLPERTESRNMERLHYSAYCV